MTKAIATAQAIGPVTLTLELSCEGAAPPANPPPVVPPPATGGTWEENGSLLGVSLLHPNSLLLKDIDTLPAHPLSRQIIEAQPIVWQPTGHRFKNDFGPDEGIPYAVGRDFPPVPISITAYPTESDAGPHPIAQGAPIEGEANPDADHHLCWLDRGSPVRLIELGKAARMGSGYSCEACAVFYPGREDDQRPLGYTSADAAGLPILPLLVRFDEFEEAMKDPDNAYLNHALRFTLPNLGKGILHPARHYATNPANTPYLLPGRPPMGIRARVKASLDLTPFTSAAKVLLRTLQKKGAVCADNGAAFFVTGTRDARWSKYWDEITGNVNGKIGFKGFAGQAFLENVEFVAYDDAEVMTQV